MLHSRLHEGRGTSVPRRPPTPLSSTTRGIQHTQPRQGRRQHLRLHKDRRQQCLLHEGAGSTVCTKAGGTTLDSPPQGLAAHAATPRSGTRGATQRDCRLRPQPASPALDGKRQRIPMPAVKLHTRASQRDCGLRPVTRESQQGCVAAGASQRDCGLGSVTRESRRTTVDKRGVAAGLRAQACDPRVPRTAARNTLCRRR